LHIVAAYVVDVELKRGIAIAKREEKRMMREVIEWTSV
jgi:hypothetical protein